MLPIAGGTSPATPAPAIPTTPDTPDTSTPAELPVRISFDSAAMTLTYAVGDSAPGGFILKATAEGKAGTTLFVDARTLDGQPDPHIDTFKVSLDGLAASIAVTPKAGLAHGIYKGSFLVRACADADCKIQHPGSPFTIGYTLEVTLPYSITSMLGMGNVRTITYDRVRDQLFMSLPTQDSGGSGLDAILRAPLSTPGTPPIQQALPGLRDIALSQDASVLVATTTGNELVLIDPENGIPKSSYIPLDTITSQGPFVENGIVSTSDGKIWYPIERSGNLHGLGYFDLNTRSFGSLNSACDFCFSGPFFAVSGDGTRMLLAPSASISSFPKMLVRDSSDGVFRENPAGLDFFYIWTSLSNDGSRFLMHGHTVYDRNFGVIGTIPAPATGLRAIQISPDGRRAYLLTYPMGASPAPDLPTVLVFDTSVKSSQTDVPLIGSFTLPDVPGCLVAAMGDECIRPRMKVLPDGNNLVIVGSEKMIVSPIPRELSGRATSTPVVLPPPPPP